MKENQKSKGWFSNVLPDFEGKRILVSGAGGYLGSNIVHVLSKAKCIIIRLTSKEALPEVKDEADIFDITADIKEKNIWKQVMRDVDIVYHFAAQTSVYRADEDPLEDLTINVVPMLHLLETCREMPSPPSILFSGTVTETGIPETLPVNEDHADKPITVYDMHKITSENYLKHYARQSIISGTVLRLANVYGPGPESSSHDRGILNMMMKKALEGESLTVYGTGESLRDYVYIDDVIQAFLLAAIHIHQLNANHYVIGSGHGKTIAQAINLIADRAALITGLRVPVNYIDPPFPQSPIEERNFQADTRKYSQVTGWKAQYPLREGVDQTLRHIKRQSENNG